VTFTPTGTGIDVDFAAAGCTFDMLITFYSPTGDAQTIDLSAATSISEALDIAATELRNRFGDTDKFMVGTWSLTGANLTGSGSVTGIIGGVTNENELEELRTTTATPVGGPPPVVNSVVMSTLTPACELRFQTSSLQTDTVLDQQYPIGTITFSIIGPKATVNAAIVFDNTPNAVINVNDVSGHFSFDLDTGDLDYQR
jgi:hypothetical protein